jgi:flagellar assembly protein FliH
VPLARASKPPQSLIIQSARELELEGEARALREELARLALLLSSVRARVLEENEPDVVRLAVAVASRVVGRELAADPTLMVGWIRDGLEALSGRDEVVVAVAPDIGEAIPLEAVSSTTATTRIVVDAALRPGTCELREGGTLVPIGASDRMAAVADTLGVDEER